MKESREKRKEEREEKGEEEEKSSKRQRMIDVDSSSSSSSSSSHSYPTLYSDVIGMVLSYLRLKDLSPAARLNREWRKTAGRIKSNKYQIIITSERVLHSIYLSRLRHHMRVKVHLPMKWWKKRPALPIPARPHLPQCVERYDVKANRLSERTTTSEQSCSGIVVSNASH